MYALTQYFLSASLEQQLELLLKGVNHESQDLRALALSKLRNLLHSNQAQLVDMISSTETVSPVISKVITAVSTPVCLL